LKSHSFSVKFISQLLLSIEGISVLPEGKSLSTKANSDIALFSKKTKAGHQERLMR